MNHTRHHEGCGNYGPPLVSRRDMLRRAGAGFGSLALAAMLADDAWAASNQQSAISNQTSDIEHRTSNIALPHFAPRAKSVIFLFMGGGPSQVDTFDPKPLLTELHGKDVPESIAKGVPRIARAPLHGLKASPYTFAKYGQSGIDVAEIFPYVAGCVDDLCVIRSMKHESPIHAPAEYIALTGTGVGDRPSLGAWVTYGLGSENRDMPAFVVMIANGDATRGPGWAAGFLPPRYQGTRVYPEGIKNITMPRGYTDESRRRQLTLIERLNENHLQRLGGAAPECKGASGASGGELEARIRSYELAFRMQMAAPEVFDLAQESAATKELYGVDPRDPQSPGDGHKATNEYGTCCLLARRMVERGVRFVQLRHGQWDQHSDLEKKHREQATHVDRPIAGLLRDLKSRGLLDETLVIWGGEFGRTPAAQGTGRDHSPSGYSLWLAGAGVRGGHVIGRTDDVGYAAIENPIHPQDLHATILAALGLDQYKLTYTHHNRDEIATVNGARVVREAFA